jgi:hypothetical protein
LRLHIERRTDREATAIEQRLPILRRLAKRRIAENLVFDVLAEERCLAVDAVGLGFLDVQLDRRRGGLVGLLLRIGGLLHEYAQVA